MPAFSKQVATWIAACAAHDLTFWADSPIPRTVWATSEDQRFHLVRVNATDRTALHICRHAKFAPGMMEVYCPGDHAARPFLPVDLVAEREGSMLLAAAALLSRTHRQAA